MVGFNCSKPALTRWLSWTTTASNCFEVAHTSPHIHHINTPLWICSRLPTRTPSIALTLILRVLEYPLSLVYELYRQPRSPWYVSNVSPIFDCSMLLYYLFWMLMGFILHFYIIFETNLLTGGPAQIVAFLPSLGFRRKGISNGVQMEWNLRERDFLNKRDPGDLEWPSRNKGGRQ